MIYKSWDSYKACKFMESNYIYKAEMPIVEIGL